MSDRLVIPDWESRAELEEIARRVKHPLFGNMLTGGVTPILSVKELEQLGYKIVVCPIESLMVCARVMRDLCARGRIPVAWTSWLRRR
jgi:2-methylisocitrate lyase-like PEP mutase family enzyme